MIGVLKRLLRDDGRLRLRAALALHGASMPAGRDEIELLQTALATRRCVACREHARCDELLAQRDWQGLRAICPNTAYIEALAPTAR